MEWRDCYGAVTMLTVSISYSLITLRVMNETGLALAGVIRKNVRGEDTPETSYGSTKSCPF
jgi:hypothetical protein